MSLVRIAWRSIQHRALSSSLTMLSMALGVALVVAVLVVLRTVDNSFRRNAEGVHLIVGAKGGRLDLVLNSVYHLGQPVAGVPYDLYFEFTNKAEGVDAAALLKRLDKDGDGQLSMATEALPLVRLLCERADRAPDGRVTEKELITACGREPYVAAKLDGTAVFRQLDTGGRGWINPKTALPEPVRTKFAEIRPLVMQDQAEQFFRQVDVNSDGWATLEELDKALRTAPYAKVDASARDVLGWAGADAAKEKRLPVSTALPPQLRTAFFPPLVSADDAEDFLDFADKQADGMVTLDELKYAVNHVGTYAGYIESAIPICVGDSLEAGGRRYRVVGTTPHMFEQEYAERQPYTFAQGRNIAADYRQTAHFFEAVLGSIVARQAGLKVGDTFRPTHGVSGDGNQHDEFTVVGVLAPTGTPNDRAVFVNIEGFYVLDNHAKDGQQRIKIVDGQLQVEPLPLEQREVSAIFLRLADKPGFIPTLTAAKIYDDLLKSDYERVARGEVSDFSQVCQAVYPTKEIFNLLDTLVGRARQILLILAILVVVVAGVGIMVAIYNSMAERLRDIAVMRALGADRQTVMLVVLLESSLLAVLGGVAGFVLAHVLLGGVLGPLIIEQWTGVSIRLFQFVEYELTLIPGLIVLSVLAGFLPGLAAYRTDVAKALSAAP